MSTTNPSAWCRSTTSPSRRREMQSGEQPLLNHMAARVLARSARGLDMTLQEPSPLLGVLQAPRAGRIGAHIRQSAPKALPVHPCLASPGCCKMMHVPAPSQVLFCIPQCDSHGRRGRAGPPVGDVVPGVAGGHGHHGRIMVGVPLSLSRAAQPRHASILTPSCAHPQVHYPVHVVAAGRHARDRRQALQPLP